MPEPVNRRQEISGILYLTVAVLLAVSYYVPSAKTGALGAALVTAGHALVGITAIALPVLFLYMALERFLASQPRMTSERFRYVSLLLLCIAALVHTLTLDSEAFRRLADSSGSGSPSAWRSLAVLLQSAVDPTRHAELAGLKSGGLLGGVIAQALATLAGSTGAAIILGAFILALIVLLFNVSYSRAINRTAQAITTTGARMNDAVRTSVQTMRQNAEADRSRARAGYDLRVGPGRTAGAGDAAALPMTLPAASAGGTAASPATGAGGKAGSPATAAGGFAQIGSGQAAGDAPAAPAGGRTSFWNSLFHPRDRNSARADGLQSDDDAAFSQATGGSAGAGQAADPLAAVPEFLRQPAEPVAAGSSGGFMLMPDAAESAALTAAGLGRPALDEDGEPDDTEGPDVILPAGVRHIDETNPLRAAMRGQGLERGSRTGPAGGTDEDDDEWADADDFDEEGIAADGAARPAADDSAVGSRRPRRVRAEQIPIPYQKPPLYLLNSETAAGVTQNLQRIPELGRKLESTLKSFGVDAKVVNYTSGATITRFELTPGPGVKVSKIVSLADDIALNLAAMGVRIEAPIPGKSAIGIEIPNKETTPVLLRAILESPEFTRATAPLTAALGRDIQGTPILCDLARMPHLLIAGSTGSGKSVCLNTILMSILFRCTPDEVKLLMIDPKVVELSMYNQIPHLLAPVVTDPRKAANTLLWAVNEMVRRYGLFAEKSVRDIHGYQEAAKASPEDFEPMPLILLVIDELADLMSTTPTEVEDAIARLTAMARAAGIHLIIATQRPSVDVITGVIKANIPSRIAFAVASQVDSRTILDMGGAEKLLGKGDMLYFPQSLAKPLRGQGAFVSDGEVEKVLAFIKSNSVSGYDPAISDAIMTAAANGGKGGDAGEQDELLPQAAEIVVEAGYASVSLLQRRMNVGYPRAARLIDRMQEKGYVGPFEGSKPRKVLLTVVQLMELKNRGEL